ncbi:hypothetical protein [Paludibacterium paludis]|uniref:Uncharacterized protein n=1 Tax=Paludibacterium paludis TaxID=1225769 RepID=A0A918P6S3_9NEIS|nr:hypothetical protein [Paludibacterium paludis]GGY27148.1 hypothetical protein GCM10011289_33210 [Paludibacterium paludis]
MKKLNKRQWAFIGLALLVFASTKLILIKWYLDHRDESASPTVPAILVCSPAKAACALPDGGTVAFATAPARDTPFVVTVSGTGKEAPAASFAMRDMDMGFNRYRFVRQGADWSARVTLPACVSGGRDWIMTLTIDGRDVQVPLTVR